MAMKLPTYNQPGWGATLNNYLRELNQRISKVEANNGSSSNGVGQVFRASAFSTGLTSTAGTCLYNGVEQCSTFRLDSGLNSLSFTGEYFISQSTVEGNAFLGELYGAEWGSNIASLSSNQVMLICADEERTLHIIPFTQAKNNRELDYNLCRLGYLTKIDDSYIYFTPCPNLAIMDLHDKYNYLMRPTYKSNDSEKPQIAVGSYSYMMEGLNYYQHFENQSKTDTTPLQVLDGELYNIHTFEGVTEYFLIQKEGEKEVITFKFVLKQLEDHINRSTNKIFIFYVTIAGIIFVREISLKEDEQIVDSTSLANFLVDTKFEENNVLFYYYSWLKPLELKRCGKDPFGNLRWHMASYNGISPQIVGTPIHTVDTNYYWADNYLLQIKNSDESARNYYGLRIRPYVQLDPHSEEGEYPDRIPNEEKTNTYVVLNVSDQSTPSTDSTKPGIFLYNYSFVEPLYFGGSNSSSSTFFVDNNAQLNLNKPLSGSLRLGENDFNPEIDDHLSLYKGSIYGRSEEADSYFKLGPIAGGDETGTIAGYEFFSANNTGVVSQPAVPFSIIANDQEVYSYRRSGEFATTAIVWDGLSTITGKVAIDISNGTSTQTGKVDFTFLSGENSKSFSGTTKDYIFSGQLNYIDGKIIISENIKVGLNSETISTDLSVTGKHLYYIQRDSHFFKHPLFISDSVSITGGLEVSESVNVAKTCSANEFEVTSDIRHKNIHGFFNFSGLNVINNLPIYKYSFKTTPNKETIGVTAQDLLKVLPQLVDTSDDSHYKINESKLVYVCIQAIKELNSKIVKLENQIQNLRGN